MASNQCGNCGEVGHYRAKCPLPKNVSLEHWRTAKKQYRKENPDQYKKLRENQGENRKWQVEGRTIPFPLLNKELCKMLQTLYDLEKSLDVLGRPKDWEEVNKKLNNLLPRIREIAHNGKGFLQYGRLNEMYMNGNGKIFVQKLEQLEESRDMIVQRVKSFVNGKLGNLARVQSRNDPAELLHYVYEQHPPKRPYTFDATGLELANVKAYLKRALLHYHPDKQSEFDEEWKCLCESISRCLTAAFTRIQTNENPVYDFHPLE